MWHAVEHSYLSDKENTKINKIYVVGMINFGNLNTFVRNEKTIKGSRSICCVLPKTKINKLKLL